MKKLFYFFIILGLHTSCKKTTDNNRNTSDDAYIKYKVNGTQVEFKGDYLHYLSTVNGIYVTKTKFPTAPQSTYIFLGQSGPNNIIRFQIETDSLQTRTYNVYPTLTTGGGNPMIIVNTKPYTAYTFDGTQKITVNISRYSQGTTDGTFSGKLYWQSISTPVTYDSINVMEGEFKNAQIIY